MESINASNVVNILSPCENTDTVFVTGAKEVQVFSHAEFGEIRVIEVDEENWFVGIDLSRNLGYQNGSRDIKRHVDDEDQKLELIPQYRNGTLGKTQSILINESGLYSLIFSSKLPSAKKFKRWVTSEILPSINKHGGYLTPNKIRESLEDPNALIELLTVLKEEQDKRIELEVINKKNEPKVIYANAVEVSSSSIPIGQLAKMIRRNNIDIGRNRLFEWMRDNGYLIKLKGREYNNPTQKAMDLEILEISQEYQLINGEYILYKTPVVTGKGQVYFINKILQECVSSNGGLM
jgi:anti-repressor protein